MAIDSPPTHPVPISRKENWVEYAAYKQVKVTKEIDIPGGTIIQSGMPFLPSLC